MKALVLSLLLLAILSTQLPSPATAQTPCTLSSCTAIVNRSIVTNNWGVTFVGDQFTLTLGSSPVSQIALGIPSTLSSKLRFTEAVDSQSNQRIFRPTEFHRDFKQLHFCVRTFPPHRRNLQCY